MPDVLEFARRQRLIPLGKGLLLRLFEWCLAASLVLTIALSLVAVYAGRYSELLTAIMSLLPITVVMILSLMIGNSGAYREGRLPPMRGLRGSEPAASQMGSMSSLGLRPPWGGLYAWKSFNDFTITQDGPGLFRVLLYRAGLSDATRLFSLALCISSIVGVAAIAIAINHIPGSPTSYALAYTSILNTVAICFTLVLTLYLMESCPVSVLLRLDGEQIALAKTYLEHWLSLDQNMKTTPTVGQSL